MWPASSRDLVPERPRGGPGNPHLNQKEHDVGVTGGDVLTTLAQLLCCSLEAHSYLLFQQREGFLNKIIANNETPQLEISRQGSWVDEQDPT